MEEVLYVLALGDTRERAVDSHPTEAAPSGLARPGRIGPTLHWNYRFACEKSHRTAALAPRIFWRSSGVNSGI